MPSRLAKSDRPCERFTEQGPHKELTHLTAYQRIDLHSPSTSATPTRITNATIQQDCSLLQLWLRNFPSLTQMILPGCLLFELSDPLLRAVDLDYQASHYNPVIPTFSPGLP